MGAIVTKTFEAIFTNGSNGAAVCAPTISIQRYDLSAFPPTVTSIVTNATMSAVLNSTYGLWTYALQYANNSLSQYKFIAVITANNGTNSCDCPVTASIQEQFAGVPQDVNQNIIANGTTGMSITAGTNGGGTITVGGNNLILPANMSLLSINGSGLVITSAGTITLTTTTTNLTNNTPTAGTITAGTLNLVNTVTTLTNNTPTAGTITVAPAPTAGTITLVQGGTINLTQTTTNLTNLPAITAGTISLVGTVQTTGGVTNGVTLAANQDVRNVTGYVAGSMNGNIGGNLLGSVGGTVSATSNAPTVQQIDTQLSGTHGAGAWGGAGGSGALTVVVPVNNTASAALQNVSVSMTINSNTYYATTDSSGHATFNLNAGTYTAAATYPGYLATGSSYTISGSGTTAPIVMTPIVIPGPANPSDCRLWMYTYDQAGNIVPGARVTWTLQSPASNVVVGSGVVYSDSTGYFQLDVTLGSGNYTLQTPTRTLTVTTANSTNSTYKVA